MSRMNEIINEQQSYQKKQQIKFEREQIENETQIKSLNMIIDDLKQQAREKTNIQQRLEAKNKEIKLLRDEIE